MNRFLRLGFYFFLTGLFILSSPALSGQIDSIQTDTNSSVSIHVDSLGVDSLMVLDSLSVDSLVADSLAADSLMAVDSVQLVVDSMRIDSNRIAALPTDTSLTDSPLVPLPHRVLSDLKEQVPYVYHNEEDKLRLHIPIFWREDLEVPLPKAVEKAGPRPPYDPEVAWQRSLILPGWGQVYNRDYWKLPIFYAGYAGGIGWIVYNHNFYLQTRTAYWASLTADLTDDDPRFANFDPDGIRGLRENFRNQRDQGILILAGWHIVQVAEAYVDAHLDGFDVSPDLSFRPHPTIIQIPSLVAGNSASMGLAFTFQF